MWRRSRLLQTRGSLKMMAMVRTSLQKVVVFLHRLQRMAISSPRYQKLCKVRGETWSSHEASGLFSLSNLLVLHASFIYLSGAGANRRHM
ncbi:unnamed protein product [Arctogadus glacialis]